MSEPSAAELAGRLGLERHPRSWRGDCPACAYPRAFAVRQGKAPGARPGFFCANGCAPDELRRAVERATGAPQRVVGGQDTAEAADRRVKRQEAALRLFAGSMPLDRPRAAPALAYLAGRGIAELARCADLRFRPDCPHPEAGRLPALVALIRDAGGNPVAVHRTYLRGDGNGKAAATPDRAALGPLWGGAVRLQDAATGERLVIGEGIESSASAGILLGAPAWAALSAGNLARGLELPASVLRVVVAADHDRRAANGSRPGQDAAREAARRWRSEGRRVEIAMPHREGCDFNDVLRDGADAA